MVGKAKWKRLELPVPGKIVNPNQGIAEVSTTVKDMKDTGVVVPSMLSFTLLFGCAEDRLWE